MRHPTFFSLFSGIGGLDLGLERAGWTCVGQVEIDDYCRQVLAKHWPEVPRWGDIKELNPDELPRADLICAGFPCQPVSVAGKGLAQDDPRWLWPHVARLVRHLRPRWVLLENVPGLLARGMGDVLGDLAACGYDAEWDCVPASAVGAPHQRDRVWIVAYPQRRGRYGLHERLEPGYLAAGMADAEGQRRRASRTQHPSQARPDNLFGHAGQQPRADHWAVEPDVGRVAHGIPARVDRLRALGNAVVPKVAEHIGQLILQAELMPTGT